MLLASASTQSSADNTFNHYFAYSCIGTWNPVPLSEVRKSVISSTVPGILVNLPDDELGNMMILREYSRVLSLCWHSRPA